MDDKNKFAFNIKCSEMPKIKPSEDGMTVSQRIASIHIRNINGLLLKELKSIGKERGIDELLVVDEDNVVDIMKRAKAFDLIAFKEVDMWLVKNCTYKDYCRIRESANIDSKIYCDDGAVIENQLTEDEFNFLKELSLRA